MAAGTGRVADAQTIFAGVQAARPESELPLVGLAISEMNRGRHLEATKLLQAAVQKNDESDLAMSFLGLALRFAGLNQASRDVSEQVVDANGNAEAVALARSILESEK